MVYGSRLDMVEKHNLDPEKWGNVPSLGFQHGARMYFGTKITGHPYVGFWNGCVLPRIGHIVTRPAQVSIAQVLFFLLCSSKTKGHYGWVFMSLLPLALAWLNDAYGIHLAVSYGVPYLESGGVQASAGVRETSHGNPIRAVVVRVLMQSSVAYLRRSSVRSTFLSFPPDSLTVARNPKGDRTYLRGAQLQRCVVPRTCA